MLNNNNCGNHLFGRYTSALVCVLITGVMFFAAFYVTSEAWHDCSGEDCPICAHIENYQSLLRTAGDGIAFAAAAALVCAIVSLTILHDPKVLSFSTPILWKTRMND
ncbi:MAG: hypothetical protein IJ109_10650 [Firmicutes bacterium]|nr:hypothetical protein [Bacillota bacterium]MBQ9016555.1 hypothetical protein [Bacillota bacterium]